MSSDQVTPHNLEAERSVLGAILIDNDTLNVAAAVIDGRAFFRDAHRRVFERMMNLSERSQPIDLVTVKEELERTGELDDVGGPAYIASLVDGVPKSTNVGHYAGIVRRKAEQRAILASCQRLHDAAMADSDEPSALLDVFRVDLEGRFAGRNRSERRVVLTSAASVAMEAVCWLEEPSLPRAAFGLLAGREGVGKSTVAYTKVADVTRGRLRGEYFGQPKPVVIAATEDSKQHTIVPRLVAAGADLELVHFVSIDMAGVEGDPVFPRDTPGLEEKIAEVGAVLVLLDPLLSRLDASLDSHKDADTRRALEPLSRLAHDTGACVLGIIHVNKSSTTDPLNMVMASRAFTAVARFVLFVTVDPNDEERRLVGLAKSNLGPCDAAPRVFRVVNHCLGVDAKGREIRTGRLEWLGEATGTIRDAVAEIAKGPENKTAVREAGLWLCDYLESVGSAAPSVETKREGQKAGHSERALQRARQHFKIEVKSDGFPRQTYWQFEQSRQPVPRSVTTGTTGATGDISNKQTHTVVPVVPVGPRPGDCGATVA